MLLLLWLWWFRALYGHQHCLIRTRRKPSLCAKSSQSAKSRQPNYNSKNMQAEYEGVTVYMSCNFSLPPSLSLQSVPCHVSHLSPCGDMTLCPSSPPHPPTVCSAGAVVPAGEWLPPTLLRHFGREPALQVSAQNKHSWLSYEPPEG